MTLIGGLNNTYRGDDEKCYTFKRRPLELKYYEYFRMIDDAITREKQIKRWSRAKKEALISGNEERLFELAKSYEGRNEQ